MDKGNQQRINLCCEVWRWSHPKPNSVQSCPSPKFQLRASTVHRYIDTFFLSLSVSDQHTLSNFGSKPNKARAMISEPRPVQSLATLMDPVSIVFFHKLSGISQRAHLTHHFSKVSLVITGFFLGFPGGPLSFCTLELLIFLLVKDFIQHDSTSCHGFLTHRTLIAGQ